MLCLEDVPFDSKLAGCVGSRSKGFGGLRIKFGGVAILLDNKVLQVCKLWCFTAGC